jgi:NAD(P)-dependent dehydrogenase (short-subunit alcohol dehydrogenase family)
MVSGPPGPAGGQPGATLAGKVAVVTGASRGIGKQVSLELARLGATVVMVARTTEPRPGTPGTLFDTLHEVEASGGRASAVAADLSSAEDVEKVASAALSQCGHVDILVNNAAYTVGRALWAHVPEITRAQWEKGVAVNLTAPLMLIQGFWASMRARGGGIVINVTSSGAQLQPEHSDSSHPDHGLSGIGTIYGSTKAALNRMTNSIASDGRPYNIALIALEPGVIRTEMMELALTERPATSGDDLTDARVPARIIGHLCRSGDAMRYSGTVVDGPELFRQLAL